MNLFEGDIAGIKYVPFKFNASLPPGVQLAAPSRKAKKWPNGIVPYTFDSDFGDKWSGQVNEALNYFMASVNLNGKQCINFVERTDEEDYISVFNGPGCYSNIGQSGGKQDISLSIDGCFLRGIIVHEFMHALGFYHEQSRPDRDDYVKIVAENVMDRETYETNFQKYLTDTILMSGPYDYGSVMHYEADAFTKNGKDTIIQLKDGPKIGQREGLSDNDISEIRKFYECASEGDIIWTHDKSANLYWAMGCDFSGNDLEQVTSKGEECGSICRNTVGCTHFTYNIQSSTCFLKKHSVDKNDASIIQPTEGVCGYLLECADENESCEYWAGIGECKANPNYMLVKCCKSCSNTIKDCNNENENCDKWASKGECTINPNYMLKSCCKSCKEWKDQDKDCINENDSCEEWASTGECTINPNYMLKSCCKSCQEWSDCSDKNDSCEEWASRGECTVNPNYMLTNCCKSCRKASNKRSIRNRRKIKK